MSKLKARSQHPGKKGHGPRSEPVLKQASTKRGPRPAPPAEASAAPKSSAPASPAPPRDPEPASAPAEVVAKTVAIEGPDGVSEPPATKRGGALGPSVEPPKLDSASDPPATKRTAAPASDAARGPATASVRIAELSEPSARTEAAPESSEPAKEPPPSRHHDIADEDSLSLSADFFHKPADSVPPHVDDFHEPAPLLIPPETLARRARFRRIVAAVVGFAGVVSIAVIARAIASQSHRRTNTPVVTATAPPSVVAAPSAVPSASAVPTAAPSAAPDAPEPSASAPTPEPVASAQAEPEKKVEPAKAEGDPVALRKEALKLLNMGKTKDAIPVARAAIAADPTDASAYLYLGSALQDSGKWKDGIEMYCECVRNATKGPVSECRQMGGHK